MRKYKVLNTQFFKNGPYSLVPIRCEDRYSIMKWRNEQMYHLRQQQPLTQAMQDRYFEEVIQQLFNQDTPDQILFSFLENDQCIGYGGLVHINWTDNNAEISFVMNTALQEERFENCWTTYLALIKKVAFKELNFRKIYTYAFDVRPKLYSALKKAGFKEECRLIDHCKVENEYKDVLIHSFWNPGINLKVRPVNENDVNLLFEWVNDSSVRENSFSPAAIPYENHVEWFQSKLNSKGSRIFIFQNAGRSVGQVRIDKNEKWWEIDYSVDKYHRGLGLGAVMIQLLIHRFPDLQLKALVRKDNVASQKVFGKLGFVSKESIGRFGKEYYYEYEYSSKS